MWLLALGIGCVPHVDIGEIPVERAARPVRVAIVDDATPSVIVRVGLGSGDDPVGREGAAARLVTSLAGPGVSVDLQPGETYFRCSGGDCAGSMRSLATGPGSAVPESSPEDPVALAWRLSVFAAHPLGRAAVRTSVAPTLAPSEIASLYRRFFVRENVTAAVSGPDASAVAAALTESLAGLSPALPPDRARVRPLPSPGPRLVTVEASSSWRLGQALASVPSSSDAEALWVYCHALGGHCQRPTVDAPWLAVEGAGSWADTWQSARREPSESEIEEANRAARSSVDPDARMRWAADDLAMRRPVRDPGAVTVARDQVVGAVRQYLSPERWTLSVGDAQPETVRITFLEGAAVWFVQPGIERPIANRMIAEEMSR